MGVCIAPLPSPTLLIRVGSHTAARTQPPPSGSTNGPSNGLKVLLVKELWLVTRRAEERREGWHHFLGRKTRGNTGVEAADWENFSHLRGSRSEKCVCDVDLWPHLSHLEEGSGGSAGYLDCPWRDQQLTDIYCTHHNEGQYHYISRQEIACVAALGTFFGEKSL